MTTVAVNQGVTAEFRVLQDYGLMPEGEVYVCESVASRGMLVALGSATGVCALVSGAMPTTAVYLGFLEQDVVADNSRSIEFGYSAQQKVGSTAGENVAIWRAGRFFVTAVSGTVSAGGLVYPGDGGKVQGAQVASAPAVGYCTKGNSNGGDPIEVEIFLIGRRSH